MKKGFSEPNKFYFPEGIDNVEVSKQNMDILEEKRILRDGNYKWKKFNLNMQKFFFNLIIILLFN